MCGKLTYLHSIDCMARQGISICGISSI